MFMDAAVLGLRRAGWGSGVEVVVTGLQAMAAKIATAATGIGAKRMVPPGKWANEGPMRRVHADGPSLSIIFPGASPHPLMEHR
jgi:hypothetical protein